MKKTHINDDQLDGNMYAWCGRGNVVVQPHQFEATKPELRCRLCERDWFPSGQPTWHLAHAMKRESML